MKIKELLESLSEVKDKVSEIRINGFHFNGFDDYKNSKDSGLGLDGDEFDVDFWRLSVEKDDIVLIIHAKKSEETEELTVSEVLESVIFDDENIIKIYSRNNVKQFDSDEDDVFVLCDYLNMDVSEYTQTHKGKHQTIEIHLKSY